MRKLVLIGFLVGSLLNVAAQKSEVRNVGSFSGIKAAEAVDVYLKKGASASVRVEVDGVDLSDVLTEDSGDYLKIHMRSGNYRRTNVKVYVTYVSLSKISASSASNVFSDGTINSQKVWISAPAVQLLLS